MVDITSPIITIVSPEPGSVNNPNNSTITALIDDGITGSGIDLSTVKVTINGTSAIVSGVVQAGFTGVIALLPDNKIEITIKRNANYSDLESVNVSISARDAEGNPAATAVFSFITEDNSDAIVINPIPTPGATQVPPSQRIAFNVRRTPRETELDLSNSLRVALVGLERDGNGDPILDGYGSPVETIFIESDNTGQLIFDQRQVSVTLDADGLGFTVTIQPINLLPLASIITVRLEVADLAGNLTQTEYSFSTIDDVAPFIINQSPLPNSISNSIATPISFSVGDHTATFLGSGVNLDSLQVSIAGQVAISNGVILSGFSGIITPNAALSGFDVSLVRDQLFAPRSRVNVEVIVSDFSLNLLKNEFNFSLEDTQPPTLVFVYPQDQSTNIPQDTIILINVESEIAVEEISLTSIEITIDTELVLQQGSFLLGYEGTITAPNKKTLAISIKPPTPFSLGSTHSVVVVAEDVFDNSVTGDIDFTVTSNVSLLTTASPTPDIYDKTGQSLDFPAVGSFLDVTLTANKSGSIIYYTLDGSDPQLNMSGMPINSTEIFNSPIRLRVTSNSIDVHLIRFFSVNSSTLEQEEPKFAFYVFSKCPEKDKWDDGGLQSGLEYTRRATFVGAHFENNSITNNLNDKEGLVTYVHDLGRASFIDKLEFTTSGLSYFRVRVADTADDLRLTPWCNALLNLHLGEGVTYTDGYGPKITVNGSGTHIEGRQQTTEAFSDEATFTVDDPLGDSFAVQTDMNLKIDLQSVVGAKSFIRLSDQSASLEVQQFVSKINASTANSQLINQSSLVGEFPNVIVDGYSIFEDGYGEGVNITGVDGYYQVTDGLHGFITLIPPSENKVEHITLGATRIIPIDDFIELEEDVTLVYGLVSTSPAIYNTFIYSADETQKIDFSSVPTSGSFTLNFGLETTAPINWDSTDSEVQQILRDLITLNDVTVTGNFTIGFTIFYGGVDADINHPPLIVQSNTLQVGSTPVLIFTQTLQQGGVTYSSALVGVLYYKPFVLDTKIAFAVGATEVPLDNVLSRVLSLNLDAVDDKFEFAETNGIFSTELLLEPGDYNFRFQVIDTAPRLIGNPFIFKTRQNLSSVQSGDQLVVLGDTELSFELRGVIKTIQNEYVLEFVDLFPTTPVDISSWEIRRNEIAIITSSQKIGVSNPLEAVIGNDATGLVANIVVNTQTTIKFTYFSSVATKVSVLGTFNSFDPEASPLAEEFDPQEIQKLFDADYLDPYLNTHVNFHKVFIEPQLPTIVDRIRFYTDVEEVEKQRTRLLIDDLPITKFLYLARNSSMVEADYILSGPLQSENEDIFESALGGVPEILNTGITPSTDEDKTSLVDLYSSKEDGFIEWSYVQIGTNKNKIPRKKIELLTRFDSYSGNPRKHLELEVFTLPSLPQFVADFTFPYGTTLVNRVNKSGFAALSNNITIKYLRLGNLEKLPVALRSFEDDGVVQNFLQAQVEAPGSLNNQAYLNVPYIFSLNEAVVLYDGLNIVRTKITNINNEDGLVTFDDPALTEGIVVKDYLIEEDENNFLIKLEVPDFTIKFHGVIFDDPGQSLSVEFQDGYGNLVVETETTNGLRVGDTVVFSSTGSLPTGLMTSQSYYVSVVLNDDKFEVSETQEGTSISFTDAGSGEAAVFYSRFDFVATSESTTLFFENTLDVAAFQLLGGKFSYPLLENPARVLAAENIDTIIGSEFKKILSVTIDVELLTTHSRLGAVIEIFNDTKMVTDYTISKTDGEIVPLNESFLSTGENLTIDYQFDPIPFQFPNQMWCFDVPSTTSEVEIVVRPIQFKVSLAEIEAFAVDFFNGVEGLAPLQVQFEINDIYRITKTLEEAIVVDGYDGYFDSNFPQTGSLRKFFVEKEEIISDGYAAENEFLNSVAIKFSGRTRYCIGELEALVTTELVDTQCRVTLNGEELFRSPFKSGPTGRYRILISEGLILVFFNGKCILRRPQIFQNPKLEFGATGKVLDDLVVANFSNTFVDRFFTESPASIEKIGRFIEIEGTVIS